MVDDVRLDAEFAKMQGQALPVLCPLFAGGQIQLRDELLRSLKRDCIAVLIVALDDLVLKLRIFRHAHPFSAAFESRQPIGRLPWRGLSAWRVRCRRSARAPCCRIPPQSINPWQSKS